MRGPQEVLFLGGRVHRGATTRPSDALLVRGDRIAAVGSEVEVRAAAGPDARVEHLDGATITPGFTDAHVHLTTWALARRYVLLKGAGTIEQAATHIASASPTAAGWILGHGWNRHEWDRLPNRRDLDRAVPHHPVFLDSQDLHAGWLNSEALKRCGIARGTPDPPGGRIERDPQTGEPTGVLFEAARAMARDSIPPPTAADIDVALLSAQAEAHGLGITGVHSVDVTGLRDFSRLLERSQLKLRVLQHIQLDQLEAAIRVGVRSGLGGDWLRVGGVKMFLDGALGSRTAWLRSPYEGSTDDFGIQTLQEEHFREAVRVAAEQGLPTAVHAIGDAAVELAIRVLLQVPAPGAIPHRIEHLQLCPPDLRELLRGSGIVASMQPAHLLTDIGPAERNWGIARSEGAYAFGSLLRSGTVLAFGSDVPVETLDPRPGLFAATHRGTWADYENDEPGAGWYPDHVITPAQAVAAYTEGPAIAAGLWHRRGRLEPGHDADLVVWSRDPITSRGAEFRSLTCDLTMVGGEVVHRRPPA
ncbi:MAG: amidohydrolase [Gemmatimonadota bacterium]